MHRASDTIQRFRSNQYEAAFVSDMQFDENWRAVFFKCTFYHFSSKQGTILGTSYIETI